MTTDPWIKQLEETADQAAEAFRELVMTVGRLRHPTQGCPWDLQQTHQTLQRYMLEEAYEAVEAMQAPQDSKLADELGDVLLQVVLNSQLGADQKSFTIVDVVNHIEQKMRRRHPHVFSPDASHAGITADGVKQNWQAIKAQERGESAEGVQQKGLFHDVKKHGFPATLQARRIGEVAEKIDFDWDTVQEVLQHFKSEVNELDHEVSASSLNKEKVFDEVGDVYFTLAHLCRHLGIDPEAAAHGGNTKFLKRFACVESLARTQGIDIKTTDRATKEKLWQEAKKPSNP